MLLLSALYVVVSAETIPPLVALPSSKMKTLED